MSAFNFISKSPPLSSLLIEDLYDSQQWGNLTPSPPVRSKPMQASYFSILDDLADPLPVSPQRQLKSEQSSPKKSPSAFAFMSPTSSHSQSSHSRHKVIKPNNEMKLISATSLLYRLSTEKNNALHTLHRLYARQWQTLDQITQLKSKIHTVQQQKDIALANEDFLVAETLQTQEQKMNSNLNELKNHKLQPQLYATWQQWCDLVQQESEAAEQVLICSEQVKEERYLQYMKFITDLERMHQQKLEELNHDRNIIESEKSEIAFDLGLWEQSHQDLVERQEDILYKDNLKKHELNTEMDSVQHEIDELKLKLNVLQSKKEALVTSIAEIESVMHEKLEPFMPETNEQEQEYQRIFTRQEEIKRKAQQLDEQEKLIDQEIQKHEEEKDRGLDELSTLDQQIETTRETSQQDATLLHEILKQIKNRDQAVLQHELELQKSREALFRKRSIIDSMQNDFYSKQQEHVQLQENKIELEQKSKRLQKLKQLAIDTGKFQQAATITNQMKSITKEIKNLDSFQGKEVEKDQALLKAQEELMTMEQTHDALKEKKNTEIKLILEQFKNEQQDKVIPLLDQELKLIDVQLQNLNIVSN